MPIYEYRCRECRKVAEETHSVHSFPTASVCPSCGGESYKIISMVQRPIVDNTDRQGFNVGAGRYFSNRREIRDYCKANNVTEVGTEGESKMKAYMAEAREAKLSGAVN